MRKVWCAALAIALTSCGATGPQVVVETSHGPVRVRVEVADSPAARERGLMGRASLDVDAGMAFVWDEDTSGSFWMKDTLIPLSVAFVDSGGRVVGIVDMEPCRADPCPVYDPRATYRIAVEVNKGAFERLGVRVGDRARLVR